VFNDRLLLNTLVAESGTSSFIDRTWGLGLTKPYRQPVPFYRTLDSPRQTVAAPSYPERAQRFCAVVGPRYAAEAVVRLDVILYWGRCSGVAMT